MHNWVGEEGGMLLLPNLERPVLSLKDVKGLYSQAKKNAFLELMLLSHRKKAAGAVGEGLEMS